MDGVWCDVCGALLMDLLAQMGGGRGVDRLQFLGPGGKDG